MQRNKLIYISSTRIPSKKANTYQSFCVCEAFAKKSLEVHFWHPSRKNDYAGTSPDTGLQEAFNAYDIKRIFSIQRRFSLDIPSLMQFSNRLWFALAAFSFSVSCLLALLKEPQNTVIYTRDSLTLSLLGVVKWCGLLKNRIFYEAHRYSPREDYFSRVIDGLVVINDCLRKLYDPDSRRDILVAHDCIRQETFLADKEVPSTMEILTKYGLPQDCRFATYVGRFQAMGNDKGIRIIIKAMKYVTEKKVIFLFVGGPLDLVSSFRLLMRQQGIEDDRAIFLDGKPVAEFRNIYHISSLLLMPYPFTPHHAYYLSPLKMFEYMTSKRPIIATCLPSIMEILRDGSNCVLCQPDDPQDLARKIGWVLDNDCSHLVDQAWRDVHHYTWDLRTGKILDWMCRHGAFPGSFGTAATDTDAYRKQGAVH